MGILYQSDLTTIKNIGKVASQIFDPTTSLYAKQHPQLYSSISSAIGPYTSRISKRQCASRRPILLQVGQRLWELWSEPNTSQAIDWAVQGVQLLLWSCLQDQGAWQFTEAQDDSWRHAKRHCFLVWSSPGWGHQLHDWWVALLAKCRSDFIWKNTIPSLLTLSSCSAC